MTSFGTRSYSDGDEDGDAAIFVRSRLRNNQTPMKTTTTVKAAIPPTMPAMSPVASSSVIDNDEEDSSVVETAMVTVLVLSSISGGLTTASVGHARIEHVATDACSQKPSLQNTQTSGDVTSPLVHNSQDPNEEHGKNRGDGVELVVGVGFVGVDVLEASGGVVVVRINVVVGLMVLCVFGADVDVRKVGTATGQSLRVVHEQAFEEVTVTGHVMQLARTEQAASAFGSCGTAPVKKLFEKSTEVSCDRPATYAATAPSNELPLRFALPSEDRPCKKLTSP
jgi:hypothetical protein